MNTTQTLQGLIDQAKKAPNGLLRNKLVSRLEDAKIVSELVDYKYLQSTTHMPDDLSTLEVPCTCLPGAKSATCPMHA